MLCRLEGVAEACAKGHGGPSQQEKSAQEERAKVQKDRKIQLQLQATEAKALALLKH
jgi:hypothetical protein